MLAAGGAGGAQVAVLLETEESVAPQWRPSARPGSGFIRRVPAVPHPPLPPPLFPPYAAKEMGRTQHSNAVAGALIDELPGSLRGCMCSGGDRPVHQAARHL